VTARVLAGLLVPADAGRLLALRPVQDSAAAISDLLGGVLLDDAVTWNLGGGVCVSVCWAEDRAGLPVNERLSVLATRLGIVDRTFHATARGDALLLGTTRQGRDLDVPGVVAVAADRCGYPVAPVTAPAPALVEAALTAHAGYQTPVQPCGRSGRGPASA
jgi:hypothetical protein